MPKLVILAAGEGKRLRPLTQARPKCLVEIKGKPLLDWQIEVAEQAGIKEIILVKGYLQEKIDRTGVRSYINKNFSTTNMVETLWCANEEFDEDIIISYGDIIYDLHILQALLESQHKISVVIDKQWESYWANRFENPLDDAESLKVDSEGKIIEIGQKTEDITKIEGQFIGLLKFQGEGLNTLISVYQEGKKCALNGQWPTGCDRKFTKIYMTDFLTGIIELGHEIFEVPVQRGWVEVDSVSDYHLASERIQLNGNTLKIT